ncbi:hypothetical protein H6G96_39755 [Nostoc sp. FACHB-892]|uniref:hypothetical protein n=1 Tax=Nostoc sp. FACHB-892 TaxID=2692843 RepID=UPI00168249DB|nr:hypothetical protein [Nostoc sp. FACHB-892]MBD2732215.1 hypothetical protein [Nostoc sp. FACHB-892]
MRIDWGGDDYTPSSDVYFKGLSGVATSPSIPRFPYSTPHHQQQYLTAAREEAQSRGCRLL